MALPLVAALGPHLAGLLPVQVLLDTEGIDAYDQVRTHLPSSQLLLAWGGLVGQLSRAQ